jgi:predicted nucleic acid-binding protein
MSVAYLDSSAIAKLVYHEPGSEELATFLATTTVVSSDVAITEVLRSARRVAEGWTPRQFGDLIEQVMETMEDMVLIVVEMATLVRAGMLEGPYLRSLDAIHVSTAKGIAAEVFVTYDERQAAAARIAGLHTIAPGLPR